MWDKETSTEKRDNATRIPNKFSLPEIFWSNE